MEKSDILTHAGPGQNIFITNPKSCSPRSDGCKSLVSGGDRLVSEQASFLEIKYFRNFKTCGEESLDLLFCFG